MTSDDILGTVKAALEASDEAVGAACMNVPVPPTIATDDAYREPYQHGYRHALSDARPVYRALVTRCEQAEAETERERLRLAACGVAAMGNTEAMVAERITPEHPYYSASYGDVCRAVDREMAHRAEYVKVMDKASAEAGRAELAEASYQEAQVTITGLEAEREHCRKGLAAMTAKRNALFDEASLSRQRHAEAVEAVNAKNVLTCVFCGKAYPPGTPSHGATVLTEHLRVCPDHPLRAAEALWDAEHATVLRLLAERDAARDRCATAEADYTTISKIHSDLCDKAWTYLNSTAEPSFDKDIVDHLIARCDAARDRATTSEASYQEAQVTITGLEAEVAHHRAEAARLREVAQALIDYQTSGAPVFDEWDKKFDALKAALEAER